VWVEADELSGFRAWWSTLPEAQRNARRAFQHGLERADIAWSAVYKRQRAVLDDVLRKLRSSEEQHAQQRALNEQLKTQLEQAIDRALDAEERVRVLTTPLAREYD
jgi:hypothetical protein